MNRERFADFLTHTRLNLDPDEEVIFIYDGAPAHNNPPVPAPNTELRKTTSIQPLPQYCRASNISALKAAIKVDISRPEIQRLMGDRDAARNRQLPLGEFSPNLLSDALQQNIGTITAAK